MTDLVDLQSAVARSASIAEVLIAPGALANAGALYIRVCGQRG
jgi:hypothetical protein